MKSFSFSSYYIGLFLLSAQEQISVDAACTSEQYSMTAMLCDLGYSDVDNQFLSSFCLCPLEVEDHDIYAFFTETVRANAWEICRRAAQHPSLLPIPDYVMNDKIRAYKSTESERIYKFSNGYFEPQVVNIPERVDPDWM